MPPKRTSLSILSGDSPASLMVRIIGSLTLLTMGMAICSSFALVMVMWRFWGPSSFMAM